MKKKDKEIQRLKDQLDDAEEAYRDLVNDYMNKCKTATTATVTSKPVKKEPKYAGSVCFDFWPLSDWTRFNIKKWNPGRYFQVNIGPIRIEWFEN